MNSESASSTPEMYPRVEESQLVAVCQHKAAVRERETLALKRRSEPSTSSESHSLPLAKA